tara:strand:- start:7399 stop:7686 length:288 start_codon:yes stop_codon:yes gene_type:complete
MKKVLSIIAVISLGAGSVFAGCGKKVDNVGTFTYNAETKTLSGGDLKKPIKILPTTKVTNADGEEATIEDIAGGKVKVVSEHNKADSVAAVKATS